MTTETINWRNLIVTADGDELGTLGSLAADPDGLPGRVEIADDGSLGGWLGYFVAAPGETAEWDTPKVNVDWSGFKEAVMG